MIIITSASSIDQEFSAEFGLLPPAFLPVGNRRLYTYQARVLPASDRRVLTVPETFDTPAFDRDRLERLGIEILCIPENLSLGESIVCAINLSGSRPDEPLKILHGDTLIMDLPSEMLDVVTLSEVDGAYNWAAWQDDGDKCLVQLDENRMVERARIANGYFAFADCGLLLRSIIHASGNFVAGINAYSRERSLTGVTVDQWFDFGHSHTFYRSKARMTRGRAFNNIKADPETVCKTSANVHKMQAEYHWFAELPGRLRIYIPQLIGQHKGAEAGYEIQYLYLASLSELFVFGRLPLFVWHKILQSCKSFLDACRDHQPDQPLALKTARLFGQKTRSRLDEWCETRDVDLHSPWTINGRDVPGIDEIVERTDALIPESDALCVVHGDWCFSNILFDFRSEGIKVIDPRGCMPDGTQSIYGDQRYDLAKFAHSVCGMYDFIVAGDYRVESHDRHLQLTLPSIPGINDVQHLFLEIAEKSFGMSRKVLCAMQVHLFLSMIPLHADDPERQTAFLANALRLYSEQD